MRKWLANGDKGARPIAPSAIPRHSSSIYLPAATRLIRVDEIYGRIRDDTADLVAHLTSARVSLITLITASPVRL